MRLKIQPSVGVGRLGNSLEFYLAPKTIGGLPIESDLYGNPTRSIKNFKDSLGQVKRQGQPFRIVTNEGEELPDGTYFYNVVTNDGKSTTGWVYIIR